MREQEINEIKNETERKLNMLDDEINNILGNLYVDLATLRLKYEFFEKPYEYNFIKKERKLRILAKENVKNNEDKLLVDEIKIFKLLTDLRYEKHSASNDTAVLESKLLKLEISPERIDRIINHFNLCHCKTNSNLTLYFNNKSLIV